MIATPRCSAVVLALAGLAVAVSSISAQSPAILSISPLAVRPGQPQEIIVRGTNLLGATQFWTSFKSQSVLTPGAPNNGKNPGQVSFRLTLPAETPPGLYGARVATGAGISPLHLILVDDLPTFTQQGANVNPASAQLVSIPAAVDGVIEPLIRRYFKFHAEPGQRLAIEVLARRIGSPLDPTLRLMDAAGREITYSDDVSGLSEDAAIDYKFPKGGDYIVEVGDNYYQGSGNYIYHLRIGDFPAAIVPVPMGVKRGSEMTIQFADISGREIEPSHVRFPADPLLFAINVPARFVGGQARGFATVALSNRKEFSEAEPNNDQKTANRVELGDNVNGILQAPNDVDRFVFSAKSGISLRFTSITRELGSPADIVLRLTKTDGSQVGRAEGTGSAEASLPVTFPSNGDYLLEVHDLNHRGGPRYAYHVEVAPGPPAFSLTAAADSLNVPAGGTVNVTVNAVRDGYAGPIALRALDLPAGVTSVPTVISPGQKDAVLTLRSTADARVGKVHPIRIVGTARLGSLDLETTAGVAQVLKENLNNMPHPPLALSEATALGIGPRPPFTLRAEPAEVVFGRGLSATVKVIAERQKGFDEPIVLAVAQEKLPVVPGTPVKFVDVLPPGVTATVKPIPKGSASAEVTFHADNRAQLSEFTAVLIGQLKKGNDTRAEPTPGIGMKLDVPFQLSLDAATGKVRRKGQLKLKVVVRRNPAFQGEIEIAISRLPKGVTAMPAKVPAGKSDLELVFSAAADATPGAARDIRVVASAPIGGSKFSTKASVAKIAVE